MPFASAWRPPICPGWWERWRVGDSAQRVRPWPGPVAIAASSPGRASRGENWLSATGALPPAGPSVVAGRGPTPSSSRRPWRGSRCPGGSARGVAVVPRASQLSLAVGIADGGGEAIRDGPGPGRAGSAGRAGKSGQERVRMVSKRRRRWTQYQGWAAAGSAVGPGPGGEAPAIPEGSGSVEPEDWARPVPWHDAHD